MKRHFLQTPATVIAGVSLIFGSAMTLAADDSTTAVTPTNAAPATQANPVQLSYGAAEVAQLAKAKVGDDTIVAFVQSSGRTYTVTAPEILALRSEGVSDRVLTAMLEQQTRKQTAAAQSAPTVAPLLPDAASQPAPAPAAQATAYAQAPAVTYVQTAPAYAPASTVYVPYAAPTYYYAPYYGYSYPPVSLSFGFGFGGYYGGYYHGGGGYHGGAATVATIEPLPLVMPRPSVSRAGLI